MFPHVPHTKKQLLAFYYCEFITTAVVFGLIYAAVEEEDSRTDNGCNNHSTAKREQEMFLIRLLIVGDSGVGKTSLLIRFHENQFLFNQKTTIGVDYKAKECEVDGELVKLQVIYFPLPRSSEKVCFTTIWLLPAAVLKDVVELY